jgi:hypothetical protein
VKSVSWRVNLYLSIFRRHCVDVNPYKSLENVAKSTELHGCNRFTTAAVGLRRLNNPVVHTRKAPETNRSEAGRTGGLASLQWLT